MKPESITILQPLPKPDAKPISLRRRAGHHVTIGRFLLERHPSGIWWLSNGTGEGMETSEKKLIRLLRDFWREEF